MFVSHGTGSEVGAGVSDEGCLIGGIAGFASCHGFDGARERFSRAV